MRAIVYMIKGMNQMRDKASRCKFSHNWMVVTSALKYLHKSDSKCLIFRRQCLAMLIGSIPAYIAFNPDDPVWGELEVIFSS